MQARDTPTICPELAEELTLAIQTLKKEAYSICRKQIIPTIFLGIATALTAMIAVGAAQKLGAIDSAADWLAGIIIFSIAYISGYFATR